MGLFSKDNDAEKILKKLVGGFLLSSTFMKQLESYGLNASEGYKIQSEIKRKIKEENLPANRVADEVLYQLKTRSNQYTNEEVSSEGSMEFTFDDNTGITLDFGTKTNEEKLKTTSADDSERAKRNRLAEKNNKRRKNADDSERAKRNRLAEKNNKGRINITQPVETKTSDGEKWLRYALNQENMLRNCPECKTKVLKEDKYCYSCGEILPKFNPIEETLNTENAPEENISNNKDTLEELEQLYTKKETEKKNAETLEELEQLYNEKISSDYSTSFKFAYTIFLDQLSRNPTKEFSKYYGMDYDTNVRLLKKQAKEDNFIKKGSPIISVKGSRVKDIKKVLKEYDLKVSGNKNELIERIDENLTQEEIKKAFPQKSIEVTQEGLNFIEENKHVLIYNSLNEIKYTIDIDKYDKLITKNKEYEQNPTNNTIYTIILDYLTEIENKEKIEEWFHYRNILTIISFIYNKFENNEKRLEYDIKRFMVYINSYPLESYKDVSAENIINVDATTKLIKLINNLNYDINELKRIFHEAYIGIKPIKMIIQEEDALIYLLKLFNGESIENVAEEIKKKY